MSLPRLDRMLRTGRAVRVGGSPRKSPFLVAIARPRRLPDSSRFRISRHRSGIRNDGGVRCRNVGRDNSAWSRRRRIAGPVRPRQPGCHRSGIRWESPRTPPFGASAHEFRELPSGHVRGGATAKPPASLWLYASPRHGRARALFPHGRNRNARSQGSQGFSGGGDFAQRRADHHRHIGKAGRKGKPLPVGEASFHTLEHPMVGRPAEQSLDA